MEKRQIKNLPSEELRRKHFIEIKSLRIHPERTCPEGLPRRIHRERINSLVTLVRGAPLLGRGLNPSGRVEKVPLRGGINSRPYGQQQLITHRAGHLVLPIGFFNSPFRTNPRPSLIAVTETRLGDDRPPP